MIMLISVIVLVDLSIFTTNFDILAAEYSCHGGDITISADQVCDGINDCPGALCVAISLESITLACAVQSYGLPSKTSGKHLSLGSV